MHSEDERIRLRGELAGLRLLTALTRLELKYRADQARVPKGQPGGGRFADEHGAGRSRLPGFIAPLAGAAARTAAAAEAGVAAAAEGAAAAGAATAGVLGGAMLGLTSDSRQPATTVPQTSRQAGDPPPEPAPKGRYEEECEEQLDADRVQCQAQAAMYGRTSKMRAQIATICGSTAMQRYSECMQDGPSAVRTPLYAAHQHTSPRRK